MQAYAAEDPQCLRGIILQQDRASPLPAPHSTLPDQPLQLPLLPEGQGAAPNVTSAIHPPEHHRAEPQSQLLPPSTAAQLSTHTSCP